MKKVYVISIPTCDVGSCGNTAQYDLPTMHGPWANLCKRHASEMSPCLLEDSIGSEFVIRKPTESSKVEGILLGREVSDILRVLMDKENRRIECPNCKTDHDVESDAEYLLTCEGCGSQIQVPTPEY